MTYIEKALAKRARRQARNRALATVVPHMMGPRRLRQRLTAAGWRWADPGTRFSLGHWYRGGRRLFV
jgi:hypothetical protein